MVRVVESTSSSARLAAAHTFVAALPRDAEILVLSATRGAADEFARAIATARGAVFGLHRLSLTQYAARLAAPHLAAAGVSPTTRLGIQAVAARAAFDAGRAGTLEYFAPVAGTPGFPRALAQTLEELALAMVPAGALATLGDGGPDIGALLDAFDAAFASAAAVERAGFLRAARAALAAPDAPFRGCRLVLLDVAVRNAAEGAFVGDAIRSAPEALVTIPAGDARTRDAVRVFGEPEVIEESASGLGRVRRYLFSPAAPPAGDPVEAVELFSAPGEGREAVEIARRILHEARLGVRFDDMAVALRAAQPYGSLLEHAFRRAGVPAYFDRGTRRPHAAGRAFLALLACALEGFSARRFAEYVSLGQVPAVDPAEGGVVATASGDEVFAMLTGGAESGTENAGTAEAAEAAQDGEDDGKEGGTPRSRAVRSPWRWERALVDSRVVAGADRWERRLAGLAAECALQRTALQRTEPDSARIEQLAQRIEDIGQLAAFAVPIVREMAAWPAEAPWAAWLARFEALAPRVLRDPSRVLRVLADLRPMGAVGPVTLDEASSVLAVRLRAVEAEPPARRYGRVLVTTPDQLRGRSFRVVFVPALAERVFPQKPREDPLLLDEARDRLGAAGAALDRQNDRAEAEKLQLALAIGAATDRVYVSFPTLEINQGRPRVPSLYVLEVWRAMTGQIPSADDLQQAAARASGATLAWPAPARPDEAIDALEHDLATLRRLIDEPDERARGRAQYILQLNAALRRSVRERFMRARRGWSNWDGIAAATPQTSPLLAPLRLGAKPYSLSALQKYATCPYQFLLSAIFRLRPPDDIGPLEKMDPLTRGTLFHAMQTEFYRRMLAAGDLPVTLANRDGALAVLDAAVEAIATDEYDSLAPAIDRVWDDEIAAIRRDLRLWVDEIAHAGGEWIPRHFEWSFGLDLAGRDPASIPDPVRVDGRFPLHGSIDLVEERQGSGELRVTDHKTGRYRGKDHMIVSGGAVLQPVLYGVALETAMRRPVVEGRLYYATTDGGCRDVRIPLTPDARRAGIEVLEIVDRAIELGVFVPAPAERACTWCDFAPVCGPDAERRARRKAPDGLPDLVALRRKP